MKVVFTATVYVDGADQPVLPPHVATLDAPEMLRPSSHQLAQALLDGVYRLQRALYREAHGERPPDAVVLPDREPELR